MAATLANRAFLILMLSGIFFNMAVGLVFDSTFMSVTYFLDAHFVAAFQSRACDLSSRCLCLPRLNTSDFRRLGKKLASVLMFLFGLVPADALGLRFLALFPANFSPNLLPMLWVFTAVSGVFTIGALDHDHLDAGRCGRGER